MVRSIPPRTMRKVWRECSENNILKESSFDIPMLSKIQKHYSREATHKYTGEAYKRPRKWQYITKPFFKRIKEPIVDVFKEAEEVQIVIDLGNFRKGELNFGLEKRKYFISGKHEDYEFNEEILLPYDVDIKNIKENFRNDILLLVLPKKRNIENRKWSRKNEKKTSNLSNR